MKKVTRKTWINSVLAIIFFLPLYWTIVTSLKDKTEIYGTPPTLILKHPTLTNYIKIFKLNDGLYRKYLLNSFIITVITILVVAIISVLAGYGFSKLELKGKRVCMACVLAAIMIPFQALLNPLYSIMSKLNILNTIPSMVLIYATFQSPFCIYMMKNAFDMVPDSLLESAKLDGAGRFSVFLRICLPLTWPSVATIAVYAAYTTWNDYLIALVFANSNSIKTFNVGLTNLAIGQYGTDWGLLTASSIIGLTPILLLFVFLQKYFIKGMLSGALK